MMKILLEFTQLENANIWEKIQQIMYSNPVFIYSEKSLAISKHNHSLNENIAQITEIKTHALNILRAIFRYSHLAEIVHNYIEDGLIAAFRNYDALTWAVNYQNIKNFVFII